MTSTAPMRGWAPACCSMSISSSARPTAAVAALTTGSAEPAKVTTLRLWVWSTGVVEDGHAVDLADGVDDLVDDLRVGGPR